MSNRRRAEAKQEGMQRRRKQDAMALAQAEVDAAKATAPAPPVEALADDASLSVADEHERDIGFASDVTELLASTDPTGRSAADLLAEAAAVEVPAPGPIAELPPDVPRAICMGDLSRAAQRTLAGLASNLHRASSQIDAFENDSTILADVRAPMGTSELVRHGLAVERRAYFITPLGERVAANACIEVTRPVAAS